MADFPKYYKVNVVSKNSENVSVDFEPIYEDLEPVVHCKDCKYFAPAIMKPYQFPNYGHCSLNFESILAVNHKNHFCWQAKRKDGDTE